MKTSELLKFIQQRLVSTVSSRQDYAEWEGYRVGLPDGSAKRPAG